MLISPIENFVLLSTILAVGCFAVAGSLRLLIKFKLCRLTTDNLIRAYTWALILPSALALWIVAAAFLPEWWMPGAFNAAHGTPHDLHLLGDLTARVEPTLAYMMLLFTVGASLFAAWSGWQSYMSVGQVVAKLHANAEPADPRQILLIEEVARRYRFEVGLVTSDYPFSFLWGFTRSKLIVSTGLLRTLNEEELIGLMEHEAAHHERRDNLIKLGLLFFSYTSLAFLLTRRLLIWRALEVERLCDEVAAARTNAPLDIASALVKLRRRSTATPIAASSFSANDVSSFHSRVSRLIESNEGNGFSHSAVRKSAWPGIAFSFLFAGSLAVSTYFFPLGFHRLAESLIQLLT